MEEIRVSSWAELQEHLFADSWHPELRRFRSSFAFRGRNDAGEDLRTAWRTRLEREGKLSASGETLRDLVLGVSSSE